MKKCVCGHTPNICSKWNNISDPDRSKWHKTWWVSCPCENAHIMLPHTSRETAIEEWNDAITMMED